MGIEEIELAGKAILSLLEDYHNPPQKELVLDAILYAYLRAKYENVTRQQHVHLYGSTKPCRIDFRLGGTNPILLEFAPRPSRGGGSLVATQNISELRKLSRVTQTSAKLRALLLLDLAPKPLAKASLKLHYDRQHAGPGRFERYPVRVVYVHRDEAFNFLWSPYRKT